MNNSHLIRICEPPMSESQDWNHCLKTVGETQDKASFSLLFEHFSPRLKSFLLKAGNLAEESAEELVQETMIKVWRRSSTYSPAQASASTWIYTIARNTRIDWFRKQSRENPDTLNADDIYDDNENESPYSTLVQIRQNDHISQRLRELPPEQSEILRMMYLQGMSGQQISDTLQVPLGTVKSRTRLALAKLKVGIASTFKPD
jgi:RNA polymerase sigma-70 factor (ECF subfamily)